MSSHQITSRRTHLKRLEAESIHIMLEVAAEFSNPVMLHLAMKAFYPSNAVSAAACRYQLEVPRDD